MLWIVSVRRVKNLFLLDTNEPRRGQPSICGMPETYFRGITSWKIGRKCPNAVLPVLFGVCWTALGMLLHLGASVYVYVRWRLHRLLCKVSWQLWRKISTRPKQHLRQSTFARKTAYVKLDAKRNHWFSIYPQNRVTTSPVLNPLSPHHHQ